MAMPPHVQRATIAEIREYYQALDEIVNIPIFLQHYGGPGGTPMAASLMAELVRACAHVRYIKEESEFSSHLITQVLELGGRQLLGVMGGKAGRHLIEEYQRGACGTMPACEVADVHVKLWQVLESGDLERARELYTHLLPLLLFETTYGAVVYKEVLRRRGVISSSRVRMVGGKQLDSQDFRELGAILERIEPLYSYRGPVRV